MKTLYAVSRSRVTPVRFYTKRSVARLHNHHFRCCALFTLDYEAALAMLKRKTLKPGIHTIRFIVEPNE